MEWLISHTQQGVPALDVIFMIAVFGAAVLLALALISLFVERDPVAERLKTAGGTRGAGELSIRY